MTMPAVRQYYYTSYVHAATGSAGFQIKAMSPGLTPRELALLARLIDYRLPPTLDARAIKSHPVALRYYVADEVCILLCSQSCGADEHGRPGNFFAHALILPPQSFAAAAPILFWKSPFWRGSDPEERMQIASLPTLPSFDIAPSLDIAQVWRFLACEQRRALLLPLLRAVIHSGSTHRRIIIRDTSEHVALWIAAVSYLLPPAYRVLLTFATYHHDPRQAPYLITGITADAPFRATEEDQRAYFILDGESGAAGTAAPSPYAALAAQAAHPDRYETLLTLFTRYAQRFSAPIAIDEGLDRLALYARIQNTCCVLAAEEVDVIHSALNTFEQQKAFNEDECEEMRRMALALCRTMQKTPACRCERRRILTLLVAHRVPLDDTLLTAFFSALSLADFSLAELALCRQYRGHRALSPDARALAESMLALSSGEMDAQQAAQLQRALARLPEREYVAALGNCIPSFLRLEISRETHFYLVQALVSPVQPPTLGVAFWRIYQETLLTMLQQAALAGRAIAIIDFWFSAPASALAREYIAQQFFLALPPLLRAAHICQDFHALAASRPWYGSIRGLFRDAMPFWARHRPIFGRRRSKGEEVRASDIGALFAGDVSVEEHARCATLYTALSPARFWPRYWKHFVALLTSRDAERSLALLAFWFERSYDLLGDAPYLPQEFFLGLGRTLAQAAQKQWFHETIDKMDAIVRSAGDDSYRWYPLLARYSGR